MLCLFISITNSKYIVKKIELGNAAVHISAYNREIKLSKIFFKHNIIMSNSIRGKHVILYHLIKIVLKHSFFETY